MGISWAELGRRVIRWSAGLPLAPLGMVTLALFLTTGRPVLREFIPADQLDFSPGEQEKGKATFRCFSPSGRCFFTSQKTFADPENAEAEFITIDVLDSVTMKRLGSVRHYRDDALFDISPDRQLLAGVQQGRMLLKNLATGEETIPEVKEPGNVNPIDERATALPEAVVFAPHSQELLFSTIGGVIHYDPEKHRIRASFGQQAAVRYFFDDRGRSKALAYDLDTERLEVWDIASHAKEAMIDDAKISNRSVLESNCVCMSLRGESILATALWNSALIAVHSLDDGRLVHLYPSPGISDYSIQASPNGRFVAYAYWARDPLVHLAEPLNTILARWLEQRRPDKDRFALIDLETGKVCRSLSGDRWCAFTDDGSRLITITEEGRYEYDVPPRWQYFTPWAWAALGAWLALAAVWCRLRKRPTRQVSQAYRKQVAG